MKSLEGTANFTWYDYSFFFLTLLFGIFIGIYFGFYKRQLTVKDYLLGGKCMRYIPVALSVVASNITGVLLLAVPADVYRYGISNWFAYFSIILVMITSYWVYIPVFLKLQVTSMFEYLKLRYDTKVCLLGSCCYLGYNLLLQPIVMYAPSLALSTATGLNVHFISVLVCAVCIFYTSLGGLKAVVYSDALQSILMFLSLTIVVGLGIFQCGFKNIWLTSYEHDRLKVVLEWDLTKRTTLWAGILGTFSVWTTFMGLNQIYIQKYLSLPTHSDMTKVFITSGVGIFICGSMGNFLGLIIYTEYSGCDPFEVGILQKLDQLVPYYIAHLSKLVPGIAGLFTAGIFSASLSTMSATLNALSATIYKDFIADHVPKSMSQKNVSLILKIVSAILGVICTCLTLLAHRFGALLMLTHFVVGLVGGPTIGLFFFGMFIPQLTAKAVYCGAWISLITVGSIVCGSLWYQFNGYITIPPLPVSTENCIDFNVTDNIQNFTLIDNLGDVPYIFRISFYWYIPMGFVIFAVVALIVSVFTKNNDVINPDLLSPIIHPFLSSEYFVHRERSEHKVVTEKLITHNNSIINY